MTIAEMSSWIKKKEEPVIALYRRYTLNRLKVKGQRKIYHSHSNHKKARVAIVILDKIGFKVKMLLGMNSNI